ncbi:aldehyde dehydrogenase family protein [Tropicibacter naphthalenivorans]|uniref:3-succinoylsemialdehyde-pyridine dehydrogenase n=1 Tax=Tropicibacter naphthalenivorans TaxID=441103 RepID=A0A0P1GYY0_9RHOB|nr:aldehyde dehydrogenase family protein [Tropicibacter naphthalenivorans]CUH81324.1 3-succinoylsemialdehyde-pyridine dehydrogenase [Tropicibacter naphthalenivorans]SMC98387.1 aldehyde dehydrogenase (NAD+) [Tropicibacter naphthalenivorans]
MQHFGQFYIDGAWVDPIAQTRFTLVNPATEEPYGTVALGTPADVDRAVQAALKVLPDFAAQSREDRIALLEGIIEVYVARQDDLMQALTLEMGAPCRLTQQTAAGLNALKQAVKTLREYAFETDMGSYILQREAIGVAGLITPWNWPVQLICNKLASAFAAGCPVVLKPSEFTPVSALVMAEILHEAGVPAGAFNLINGDGPGVGNAISKHDDIAVVSFTGSTRAGVLVAQAAAPSVKRVTQELGGKSANLILPDGDVQAAAEYNVTRGYSNSGQSCHSPTRILVPEAKLEELVGHLQTAVAKHITVGDPTAPETTHGPVVNRAQFDRIQAYIQSALDEGARLVCGGLGRPDGLAKGFFIRPTIFVVTPETTIAREEIFGMVTSVLTYKTDEEAIALANDTEYGLGAYVFGADKAADLDICRRMKAGRVFYNGAAAITEAPMGGYKKSGNGREMGEFGMEEYLEIKAIIGF